jgi:hypothetical protein
MRIQYSPGAQSLAGFRNIDSPQIWAIETPVGGSTSTVTAASGDTNIATTTVTSTSNDCQIKVGSGALPLGPVTFINKTPSICSVSESGAVTRIINGDAVVDVLAGGVRKNFARTLNQTSTVLSKAFSSWVPGSLGDHIETSIAAMISGKTPGSRRKVFSLLRAAELQHQPTLEIRRYLLGRFRYTLSLSTSLNMGAIFSRWC